MLPLLLGALVPLIGDILKRVLPEEKMSEEDRVKVEAQVTLALAQMDFSQLESQLKINLEEAKSQSVFVAGWRPAVGWVCATALGYSFVLQPFLAFTVSLWTKDLPPVPVLDWGALSVILMGLLGLGGMRSWEKIKGVASGA